jgi:uncharacterized damage-inducible protein DinB
MSRPAGLAADPLDILIRHNDWATRRVIDFCREIDPALLHQQVAIGPGSLHDNLTHLIAAMRRWADRIEQRPLRPSLELPEGSSWSFVDPDAGAKPATPRRTLDQLAGLLGDASDDLAAIASRARAKGLETPFTVAFGAKSYSFSIAAAITHVLTHGTHHRAQCLFILKQLNAPCFSDGAPEIGVVDWQAEAETHELTPYSPRAFTGEHETSR